MQRYSKLADVSRIGRSTGVRDVPIEHSARRVHNIYRRFGPEAITQLVTDYQAGASTLALMRKYSIGKGTVLRLLDARGVECRHQPLTEEQAQRAVELYQRGWSRARVGEQLGRDGTVILLALKRADIPRRDTHGRVK